MSGKQTTATATTEADPYGMTNKKDNCNSKKQQQIPCGMTNKKSKSNGNRRLFGLATGTMNVL